MKQLWKRPIWKLNGNNRVSSWASDKRFVQVVCVVNRSQLSSIGILFCMFFVQYCVMDILFVVYGWEIGPGRGQSVQHSAQTASRAVGKSNKKAEVIYCALLSNFNMYEATVNSFVSVKTNLDDQSCLKFWIFKWYVSPKNRLKENWHFYFHF